MKRFSTRLLTVAATGGVLAVATGAAPAIAGAQPAAASKPAHAPGCRSGSLPASILGNPHVKPGSTEGLYVFHDKGGYNIRVTHPGSSKVVFTGTITDGRGFSHLKSYRTEGGDFVTETANRREVVFRFTNFGGIDGLRVNADCAHAVTFNFKIDDATAPTSAVFLGKDKVNPTSVPFTVGRTKPLKSHHKSGTAPHHTTA